MNVEEESLFWVRVNQFQGVSTTKNLRRERGTPSIFLEHFWTENDYWVPGYVPGIVVDCSRYREYNDNQRMVSDLQKAYWGRKNNAEESKAWCDKWSETDMYLGAMAV